MANDVDISFGAKLDEFDKGMATAKSRMADLQTQTDSLSAAFNDFGDAVKKATDAAADQVGHLSDVIKTLNDAIEKGGNISTTSGLFGLLSSRLGIVGIIIAGIVEGVHVLGEEMIKLETSSNEAALSMNRFQELKLVFNQAGVSSEKVASGLKEVAKNLLELEYDDTSGFGKFLKANNIELKDSGDKIKDMNDYLRQSAELLQRAVAEGGVPLANKVAESLHISEELAHSLMRGVTVLDQAAKKAADAGAVLDAELVHKAAEFEKEWNAATSSMATWLKAQLVGLLPFIQEWASKIGTMISDAFKWGFKQAKYALDDSLVAMKKTDFSSRFAPVEGTAPLAPLTDQVNSLAAAFGVAVKEAKNLGGELDGMKSSGKDFDDIKFPDDKDKKKKTDTTEMTALNEQLDQWREYYAKLVVYEKNQVDTSKQTESQKVSNLIAALGERETAEKAIFEKEISQAGANANQVAQIRRKMNKEIETIDKERLQLEAENLKRSAQEWQSALGSITGAFNSQLRGLLAGTTSWSTAMKNIAGDLVIKIIEEFEKLALVKPLTAMLANITPPTELFASLIKMVSGLFGPLMTSFTSFFAPILGPAAPAAGAAEAAAVVAAGTAAVGSFEVGTDYVPKTGLALVHQGEAIIPAAQNAAGGGGGGANVSFNISAIDRGSVLTFLNRYGPQISRSVASYTAQNPSMAG